MSARRGPPWAGRRMAEVRELVTQAGPEDVADRLAAVRERVAVAAGRVGRPAAGRDPRPAFAALAALADRLGLPEVSMGMSEDFEVAVEEGATIVRVGRAIFGPRRQGPR